MKRNDGLHSCRIWRVTQRHNVSEPGSANFWLASDNPGNLFFNPSLSPVHIGM